MKLEVVVEVSVEMMLKQHVLLLLKPGVGKCFEQGSQFAFSRLA